MIVEWVRGGEPGSRETADGDALAAELWADPEVAAVRVLPAPGAPPSARYVRPGALAALPASWRPPGPDGATAPALPAPARPAGVLARPAAGPAPSERACRECLREPPDGLSSHDGGRPPAERIDERRCGSCGHPEPALTRGDLHRRHVGRPPG